MGPIANLTMNMFAAKKLLGREPAADETPIVLDEFANTASAGSLIAFHRHKDGFAPGDKGLICDLARNLLAKAKTRNDKYNDKRRAKTKLKLQDFRR